MTPKTPAHEQLIDTSAESTIEHVWHAKDAETERLRAMVLSLQQQLAARVQSKPTEWIAGILGAIGATLLAVNVHPGWGFAFFLASNAVWIKYARVGRLFGMLTMQLVFTVTSVVGLWNWLVGPWLLG